MADNLSYTPGAGATIATDELASGAHAQRVKLVYSDTSGTDIGADANGLDVDVTRVSGNVTVVQSTGTNLKVDASDNAVPVTDNAGSLTVDAPVATPVFVRLSDGASAITALPVTDNGATLSVDDGGGALTVDGTVAATQSGTWNVATLTSITNDVNIADGGNVISVDDGAGSLTVDGTVTVTQGNAGSIGQSWFTKVGDGTNSCTVTNVGADYGLDVNIISQTGGAVHADSDVFTEGTSNVQALAGVYNPTRVASVSDNDVSVVRVTDQGDLQVNLVASAGTEVGTSGAPLRIDPTGTTNQPVNLAQVGGNAVATGASGIMKVALTDEVGTAYSGSNVLQVGLYDESGTAFSTSNTLPVDIINGGSVLSETNAIYVEPTKLGKTPVRKLDDFGASETGTTVWTPAAGKKFIIDTLILSATGAGTITIFDNTDTAANTIFKSTLVVGDQIVVPYNGHPSSTADNVLKFTTGAGATGHLTVVGWESD